MVTNVIEPLAVGIILHINPVFLIKQEQVHVIQERTACVLEGLIVAPSHNNQAVILRKVCHGVAIPSDRRSSRCFEVDKLSVDYFGVDGVGLEKSELVTKNPLIVLASEVVNSFLNSIGS